MTILPSQTTPKQPTYFRLISMRNTWLFLLAITLARIAIIGLSPLGPGVDEAQYWLWGQDIQLGYYSKPPLIAWLLGLMNGLFGQSNFSLRLAGPILHLGTSLVLWQAGAKLGGALAGRIAALLWLSLPAVGLGSFVMSTDSVMLPFWAIGLGCVLIAHQQNRHYIRYMAIAGGAIGLASLAKYAGLYFLFCLLLFLLISGRPEQPRLKGFCVFLIMVLVVSSPTWIWNLTHEFVTLHHLGENANLAKQSYSFRSMGAFLGAQFAVFGPLSLGCLLGLFHYREMRSGLLAGLQAFIWPVMIFMSVQAYVSEANANWAVASYPAATLLLSVGFTQLFEKWAGRWVVPSLCVNFILTALLGTVLAAGSFGEFAPKSDPLRRLRGWEALAHETDRLAQQNGAKTLIAYSRASAALLHWHLGSKGYYIALPLGNAASGTGNHYQRSYPLNTDSPRPWLALNEKTGLPEIDGPVWQGPVGEFQVAISASHRRSASFWLAR